MEEGERREKKRREEEGRRGENERGGSEIKKKEEGRRKKKEEERRRKARERAFDSDRGCNEECYLLCALLLLSQLYLLNSPTAVHFMHTSSVLHTAIYLQNLNGDTESSSLKMAIIITPLHSYFLLLLLLSHMNTPLFSHLDFCYIQ